jgi:hypothetical protein
MKNELLLSIEAEALRHCRNDNFDQAKFDQLNRYFDQSNHEIDDAFARQVCALLARPIPPFDPKNIETDPVNERKISHFFTFARYFYGDVQECAE